MQKTKEFIKEFTFKNPENNDKVDLTDFTNEIDNAVNEALPDYYEPFVSVEKGNFIIKTAKPITKGQAQKIGKEIAKIPEIGELCKGYDYSNGRHSNQIFVGKDISS